MFKIDINRPKEPRTIKKTYRLPIKLVKALEVLKKGSGVSETQIVVQMIEHCMSDDINLK